MITRLAALFLFIISCHSVEAQITLQFLNGSTKVPFVAILDSAIKFYSVSDSNGRCRVPAGEYHFLISHVSYETDFIDIKLPMGDTIIMIQLHPKAILLENYTISINRKTARKRLIDYGNRYKKTRSVVKFGLNARIGMFFKPEISGRRAYLNSVKFKLRDVEGFKKLKDNLEIKIYGVQDGAITSDPINTRQLIIPLRKLRVSNEVKTDEIIPISNEGIFVCFELPNVFGEGDDLSLNFLLSVDNDQCNFYNGRVTTVMWTPQNIWKYRNCTITPYTGKYAQLNVGITYY